MPYTRRTRGAPAPHAIHQRDVWSLALPHPPWMRRSLQELEKWKLIGKTSMSDHDLERWTNSSRKHAQKTSQFEAEETALARGKVLRHPYPHPNPCLDPNPSLNPSLNPSPSPSPSPNARCCASCPSGSRPPSRPARGPSTGLGSRLRPEARGWGSSSGSASRRRPLRFEAPPPSWDHATRTRCRRSARRSASGSHRPRADAPGRRRPARRRRHRRHRHRHRHPPPRRLPPRPPRSPRLQRRRRQQRHRQQRHRRRWRRRCLLRSRPLPPPLRARPRARPPPKV